MSYATIDDLRSQLGSVSSNQPSPAYAAKMLHPIPDLPVVERNKFILKRCQGKRVLEFGASGPLHEAIVKVASFLYASDRSAPGVNENLDLDDVSKPYVTVEGAHNIKPDIIICGEVLEHLTNPGWFLTRLRRQYEGVPVIVTVPNAFGSAAQKHMALGVENVNRDHCCWYSFTTIHVLLRKVGYEPVDVAWYRGQPVTAEGLVVVCA